MPGKPGMIIARNGGCFRFGSEKGDRIVAGVHATRRANSERVPCPHCTLTISPAGLQRHIDLCHSED